MRKKVLFSKRFSSIFLSGLFLFALNILEAAQSKNLTNNRMLSQPNWTFDITAQLEKVYANDKQSALKSKGMSYVDALSRKFESERVVPRGDDVFWKGTITVPQSSKDATALVLQFDEGRVIENLWVNGKKLIGDRKALGNRWEGGEMSFALPALKAGSTIDLVIQNKDLTHLYANSFGRVILRPAFIDERLMLERPKSANNKNVEPAKAELVAGSTAKLVNLTAYPQKGILLISQEDFFGTPLAEKKIEFNLKPNESYAIEWAKSLPNGTLWKSVFYVLQGDEKSYEYWDYVKAEQYDVVRGKYQRFSTTNWKRVSAPTQKEFSYPIPTEGVVTVKLPNRPTTKESPTHKMWYVNNFTVPANWTNDRVLLHLRNLILCADIFVDGKYVGKKYNWELPGQIDITDFVTPGKTHELALGLTDYSVAIRDNVEKPKDGQHNAAAETLTAAVGFLPNEGTPALLSVPELWAVPAVRTDLAIIRTQVVDEKKLTMIMEFCNDSKSTEQVTMEATVYSKGVETLKLKPQNLTLKPKKVEKLTISTAWDNPILWTLDNPHLYEMRIVLKNKKGEILDTRKERFGFREYGVKGRFFTINGEIIKPYGSGHQIARSKTWPQIPETQYIFRHAIKGTVGFLQGIDINWICDEKGVLIKDENMRHNAHGGRRFAYDIPITFERLLSEMRSVYRFRPNNASTMIWDLANEVNFTPKNEAENWGKFYASIKEMDPTRLVTNSGGVGTPIGEKVEIYDTHCNTDPFSREVWWYTHPEDRPYYLKDNFRFSAWIPKGEDPAKWTLSTIRAGGRLQHLGGKPLLFSESLNCNSFERYPLVGQQNYKPIPASPNSWAYGFSFEQLGWQVARKYMIEYGRQAQLSGWLCHVNRAYGKCQAPIVAFPLNRSLRFYPNQPIKLSFSIHNDRQQTETLDLNWSLFKGTQEVAKYSKSYKIDAGNIEFAEIPLSAANKVAVGDYDLVWTITTANKDVWWQDNARLTVMEKPVIPSKGYALFDPQDVLKNFIPADVLKLSKLEDWNGKMPLLIASDALASVPANSLAKLRANVMNGSRVVLLDHAKVPTFLDNQPVYDTYHMNTAAAIDPNSEITSGTTIEDFRFWNTSDDDHIVICGVYDIPRKGNFRNHLISGKEMTVKHTPLVDVQSGKGNVLFSSLNMKRALGYEPMAEEMLNRIVKWLLLPTPNDYLKSAILAVEDKTFTDTLQKSYNVEATPISDLAELNSYQALIINGKDSGVVKTLSNNGSTVNKWLQNGGTLMVLGADAKCAKALADITQKDIKVENFAFGQTYLTSFDPIVAGLVHSDLMWYTGPRSDGMQAVPLKNEKPNQNHTGYVKFEGKDVRKLTIPSYIGVVDCQKGKIILDNVRHFERTTPIAQRVLTMLIKNSGIPFTTVSAKTGDDVNRWDFTYVNLREFCNRQFLDDYKAKVRGWHGEGPVNDLHIPLGEQTFEGVKFDIIDPATNGDRSIIAMAGTREIGVLPSEVTNIKVNCKAERLIFLYSAAWGAPGMTFKVWNENYRHWIPTEPDPFTLVHIKPNEDIKDWTAAGRVSDGELFLPGAKVAWATTSGWSKNVKVGVYMKVWENPLPDKIIEKIDILSPGKEGNGQAFILAITAASEKKVEKISLEKVLPKNVKASSVYTQLQNEKYGFVMLKNGTIPVIYNKEGKAVVQIPGWNAQGMKKEPGQNPTFKSFGTQDSSKDIVIKESKSPMGHPTITISGKGSFFDWQESVVMKGEQIDISYTFSVTKDASTEWNPNMNLSVKNLASGLAGGFSKPNANPVQVITELGLTEINFSKEWRTWFKGYSARNGVLSVTAFKDARTEGATATVSFSISLP